MLTFWSFGLGVAPQRTGRWPKVREVVQSATIARTENSWGVVVQVGGGRQLPGQRFDLQAFELVPNFALSWGGGGGFCHSGGYVLLAQGMMTLSRDFTL
jgi:hypothetical protein